MNILGQYFGPPEMSSVYLESVQYGIGLQYTPINCAVVSHEMISCLTVAGVGPDQKWQVRLVCYGVWVCLCGWGARSGCPSWLRVGSSVFVAPW